MRFLIVCMMNNNSSVFHDCICYDELTLSCGIKVIYWGFLCEKWRFYKDINCSKMCISSLPQ